MHHIICGSRPRCGFRVEENYYQTKRRFMPGICARCNGPIEIVEAYTEKVVQGARLDLETGQVILSPIVPQLNP